MTSTSVTNVAIAEMMTEPVSHPSIIAISIADAKNQIFVSIFSKSKATAEPTATQETWVYDNTPQ